MNELKRELSKITGIDFFNPKFREVFKKYFPNDKDLEEEKLEEIINEDKEENSEMDKNEGENSDAVTNVQNPDVDDNEEEKNEEVLKVEEPDDTDLEPEESQTDVSELVQEDGSTDELANSKRELLDAKIELELIKNGVSPERLESAKKLAKYEITSLDELGKIKDLIREYPEWVRSFEVQNFGMPVDEMSDDLTAEEKRLKEMGINPRD